MQRVTRQSSPAGLMSAGAVVAAVVGAFGCEEPPCTDNFDCTSGQVCTDGLCVNQGGGGGGGNEGEGEGEGESDSPVLLQTDFPISMLVPGTAVGEAAGLAVVGENGDGIDRVRFFDVSAGDFVETPAGIDFTNTAIGGGTCGIDDISLQAGVDPSDLADELWFSCASGLQQALTDEFNFDVITHANRGADLLVAFNNADIIDRDVVARRMYAHRGDPALYVERVVQNQQDRPTPRPEDTVAVTFGAIAGIFPIAESNGTTFGDIAFVFDRSYPDNNDEPTLVPIERVGDGTEWQLAHAPWRALALPAATHAVRVGGVPDPAELVVDAAQAAQQNLAVFLPTLGQVVFARIETEMSTDGVVGVDDTGFNVLQVNDEKPASVPLASARILLVDDPTANAVFYVLRGENRAYGWRLPLHVTQNDDFTNDVEFANFVNDTVDVPNGIVAIPGVNNAVWISVSSDNALHRVPFAANN